MQTEQARTELFDVINVDLKTKMVRVIAEAKSESDAEAVVKMAVIRRGVTKDFYLAIKAGSYKTGDTYL